MIVSGNPIKQLKKQLKSCFGIGFKEIMLLKKAYPFVLKRMNDCFLHINNKYYSKDNIPFFDTIHVGQWTMFLYLMSNEINKCEKASRGGDIICSKIYFLLKMISSMDLYFQINMPSIWFSDHPQGSVIGRANYSNYFSFSQGCTVGNNKGLYPSFGEHVSMFSNSKVLGNCKIGDYVIISANCYIKDTDIPSYSLVFGSSPNLRIKTITEEQFYKYTGSMFKSN